MVKHEKPDTRRLADAFARYGPAATIVAMLLLMAFAMFLLPRL